jgi:UDP-glucose:(heptosyl)LPS alpha-1,3-glucosyltransferase
MKLLIIARPFVFHGGVERATAGLVGALVEHGYDVHLLTPRGQYAVPGVTQHALALAAVARLAAARGTWDIVQSHERTLRQDVYRAGEGCHRAYLASLGGGGRGLYHRIVLGLERRVFAGTPEIVAIAKRGAAEIAALYAVAPARLSVVYNGVDLERFHPRLRDAHRAAARAEVGVPPEAWTLLFAGSGFPRKGLDVALRALHALGDGAAHLIVIGRGDVAPYRALARELGVDGRVVWLGVRPDIERWYAAADVLVLPTRYEPFGNVHLEALATGLPVVTSRVAGGAEVVDALCGAAVDPRSADEFAGAVARLRARSEAEVRAAARAAAEPFTFARQVSDLERLYKRVGGRNR